MQGCGNIYIKCKQHHGQQPYHLLGWLRKQKQWHVQQRRGQAQMPVADLPNPPASRTESKDMLPCLNCALILLSLFLCWFPKGSQTSSSTLRTRSTCTQLPHTIIHYIHLEHNHLEYIFLILLLS